MLDIDDSFDIYISNKPVDMRKAVNGLSLIVLEELELPPQSEAMFIFFNRRKDRIKILMWHKNGFVLFYKRLEKIRFKFPRHTEDCYTISKKQLSWLIAGLDFHLMNEFKSLDFKHFF